MLKNLVPRLYQETIMATASQKNTLVVLPTGMGKTAISMMLSVHRMQCFPSSKVIILAPTKPLAQQHLASFTEHLEIDNNSLVLFTGEVAPEKRASLWQNAKIIFSTPQGLENDIINSKIGLDEVSLMVFDEAHRAAGDYAYNFIASQYEKKARFPRILALTASPGSDLDKISEVCRNLFIEAIEVRTDESPDVAQYIQEIDMKIIEVILPEPFQAIRKHLVKCYSSKLKEVKQSGLIDKSVSLSSMSKKELLGIMAGLHARLNQGEKDFDAMKGISLMAEAMKVQHGIELIETQGINPLYAYMRKLMSEAISTKVKAVKNLVRDEDFKAAYYLCSELYEKKVEHPKLEILKELIRKEAKDKNVKIIVFNQYRDTASNIEEELNKIENVKSKIFVGQMKKGETGLSQKKQKEVLDKFRNGEFNVLISTSIGEEGLDIPKVDLVVFYEPIPSAIRHIQRRGRTGRQEKGRVIILMAKGTRDEAYRWSAKNKESSMHRNLLSVQSKLRNVLKEVEGRKRNQTLDIYSEKAIKIFADHREKTAGAVKELVNSNVDLSLQALDVGDYILSERVGVELKTISDFVNSIIDGRLLVQVKELKQSFERPLIIIEGVDDIYSQRNIHPNAIRGMLATITISYGIPVIFTKNPKESAAMMLIIAKREQEDCKKCFSMHAEKKVMSLKETQEFIVSALPGVGLGLAKDLLQEFGSVKKVFDASEEELKKVDKIGEKKAKNIKDVVDGDYQQ